MATHTKKSFILSSEVTKQILFKTTFQLKSQATFVLTLKFLWVALILKIPNRKGAFALQLHRRWCSWHWPLNPPNWTHLFIWDPLRLVQREGAGEGAVLRHHAKPAGAADEFLSVGDWRHDALATLSPCFLPSATHWRADTPSAVIDGRGDESERRVEVTWGVFGVCAPRLKK